MQNIEKIVRIQKLPFDQLSHDEKKLFQEALKARNNAQAPYSKYHVGVAILSDKGTMHSGCNVERCSYTQTTHAEQNAIDSMIAAIGPSKIEKVAVIGALKEVTISLTEPSNIAISNVTCGHCLQIIWENCCNDATVKILNLEGNGIVACATIEDLLPFRFGPENLNIFYQKLPLKNKSESMCL